MYKVILVGNGRTIVLGEFNFFGEEEKPATVLDQAFQYIADHAAEKLSLTEVASQVHVSPTYLGKLIHKVSGMSFPNVAHEARIEKAKELLKNPQNKISDIAYGLGFSDPAHFSRAFKEITGLSPSAWRKSLCRVSMKTNNECRRASDHQPSNT